MLNSFVLLLYFCQAAITKTTQPEKVCGYSGARGSKIEQDLDDCFNQKVVESRMKMALGFEICFGFNYQTLNITVAEPLEARQKSANRQLINLSIETCVDHNEFEAKEDSTGIEKKINNCKHYFNVIIQAMYSDDESIETYIDSQSKFIVPLISKSGFADLKTKIIAIISPIDECKEPLALFRIKLIKKYLEMYLNRAVSPTAPSYNDETYPVFQNPEVYIKQSSNIMRTDILELLESKRKKRNLLNERRPIIIKKRSEGEDDMSETEKKKSIADKLLGFFHDGNDEEQASEALDKEDKKDKDKLNEGKALTHPEKDVDEMLEDSDTDVDHNIEELRAKDHSHENNDVVIDDFFDENLEIKKKKLGRHDFDNYKIKGFNVDRTLKKLFNR